MRRSPTRPELLRRLAPAGIRRRPLGQRAEARQRNSAGRTACADGWVGGRDIKMSRNCSRDTDGVVSYCPPRKKGADRLSHKQQLRIEITFGTPPPGPHTALRPISNLAPAHGPHQRARGGGGGANHEHAKGPNTPRGRKTLESAGEPPLCLFGVLRGPPARWSPNPCPPQVPWYLAPPNALLVSQQNHS